MGDVRVFFYKATLRLGIPRCQFQAGVQAAIMCTVSPRTTQPARYAPFGRTSLPLTVYFGTQLLLLLRCLTASCGGEITV